MGTETAKPHAPLPWSTLPFVDGIDIVDANGDVVARIADRRLDLTGMPPANAELLVRAVNATVGS